MSERWSAIAVWTAFALLTGTAADLSLMACDFGPHPLFGLTYCRVPERDGPLVAEQERERILLDRLYEAQLNLSRLPICLPDPPRPRPVLRAENIAPTPTPTPTPTPSPTPTPTPTPSRTPDDLLTIPRKLSEVKGCWQSVDGDIPMVSETDGRPTGTARICYCIGDSGRGQTRYVWSDGTKCIGPLRAQISENRLLMKHPRFDCTVDNGGVSAGDIVCSKEAGTNSVTCISYHPVSHHTSHDGQFRRVSAEYCK